MTRSSVRFRQAAQKRPLTCSDAGQGPFAWAALMAEVRFWCVLLHARVLMARRLANVSEVRRWPGVLHVRQAVQSTGTCRRLRGGAAPCHWPGRPLIRGETEPNAERAQR